MNLTEYNNVKDYAYSEYCEYLKNKYGKATVNYMTKSWNKNPKVTRTNEGLYCHHIFEDHAILLADKEHAQLNPYEWQLAENLCYCDLLEHLFLHILICENPSIDKNLLESVGIGGVLTFFIPELNDIYSGFQSSLKWQINCHNRIKNDKDMYIELIRRLKNLKDYPLYDESKIYRSMNAQYGIWPDNNNISLYEELREI